MAPLPVPDSGIFVIPLEQERYLVYAPLRKAAFVGNARVVNFLAGLRDGEYDASADPGGATTAFLRRLEMLDAGPARPPETSFPDTPDPVSVTLFLTTACNLRCTHLLLCRCRGRPRALHALGYRPARH